MQSSIGKSLRIFIFLLIMFSMVTINVTAEENLLNSEQEKTFNSENIDSTHPQSSQNENGNIGVNDQLGVTSNINADALFSPRLSAPGTDNAYYYAANPFYQSGYGMPNCTCYAWGRAYELLGGRPNLSTGNANSFWGTNINRGAFASGSSPRLGAIACWGNDYGHVAVVEKIEGNVVTISESSWGGFLFRTSTYTIGSENSRSPGGFQGYIYLGDFSITPPDTNPPTISNIQITDVNAEGFTVRCNVSDNVGVTRVNYATWTDANGQDELNFVDGWLSGGDSSFRVLYSDHKNERGSYKVDIRAYDAAGNCVGPITTGTTVDDIPPTIENVEVIDQSPYGYQIKCKVADNNGINRVQFPTWTSANGQDDINPNWPADGTCSGIIEGDTVTYTVKDSDHRYERGEYITHIYAYDTFGNQKVYEIKQNVINKDNIVSEETLNNHRYILFDDILNWKEAEAKAEEQGGTLVTIASQDEQSLVERLIGVGQRYQYFMGGTDENQEGTFRWITGDLIGLAKWGSGEPNNAGGSENYLQIGKTGFWNDIPVTSLSSGYIVEIDRDKLQIDSFKTSDDTSPYVNRNIELTAAVTGGVGPIQYKFYYKLGDTSTVIQDYSETNTAIFKPVTAGTYTLYVDVKDSEGRTATRSISDYIVQKTIGITYQTQIQNIGWQDPVSNGTMSGTSGEGLRLEGIKINLDTQGYDVGVSYQTHIENIGWEADTDRGWKSNGVMSGTEGLGYRLEAIQIKLTGVDADKFDIYYQVHAQNFGWLDWAKNGESAGTAGFGYRLEAINIVVVPKNGTAPGTSDRVFVQK